MDRDVHSCVESFILRKTSFANENDRRMDEKMKKALIVTTVSGFVPQFEMNNVRILQELDYEVHYASNFKNPHYGSDNKRLDGTGIVQHQVDFVRAPFRIRENWRAYQQLKKVMEEERPELVHCHTPMGGVLGRLAAERVRRKKERGKENRGHTAKVLYTAHGFHFYKGAPWINWIIYYPVERIMAHITDVLFTINEEDYKRAQKFHLRREKEEKGKLIKVNGIGINVEAYQDTTEIDKDKYRKRLGLTPDEKMLLSVGELTKRKNHQIAVRALAVFEQKHTNEKVHYFICGEGPERKNLEDLIRKNNIEDTVTLLGYCKDVKELLAITDCFIFPSKQEGLPVALLEAAAAKVPVVCSRIRGNIDVVKNQSSYFDIRNELDCAERIWSRLHEPCYCENLNSYTEKQVIQRMKEVYRYCKTDGN